MEVLWLLSCRLNDSATGIHDNFLKLPIKKSPPCRVVRQGGDFVIQACFFNISLCFMILAIFIFIMEGL